MSQIVVRQLLEPTDAQLDAIVDLCVRAYDGDIMTKIFTGDDSTLSDPLWRSMIRAGIHSGVLYVASDGADEIHSFGVWFGPGQTLYATPEQRALGFTDFLQQLSAEHRDWFLNDFSRKVRDFKLRALGENTERDSWYGNLIATDPNYQGRGLASAIIETICKRAAENRDVVALGTQTERNAVFYRNLGFIEHGRMDEVTKWGVFTGNIFTRNPSA
ncbi:hypothetical protein BV25DRAFT_1819748 [Artomyces pyxidatus]|uniref:Uncharacterized protein n=1 Tax=Artomyces pyxidatus TaxID=48021 RepID=A0ACB8TG76_9AGAM|nr:hypothetical protein BV25DRAFT_1819748 [Artomyces pyxidatus]